MDGGDVSLSIRRARRSGAKSLDLSHRGLCEWPDGIFGLRHLESLDMSGNQLTFVDSGVKQLELLEELNLSNNRIAKLPEFDLSDLRQLRSLALDGNPVASRLAPATVRQLTQPPRTPGETPAQVIRGLLAGAARGAAVGATGAARVSPAAASDVEELTASEGFGPESSRVDIGTLLTGDGGEAAPWRKEQKTMLKEIERLQARINELEAASSRGAAEAPKADGSLPAWLREEPRNQRLSSTLPSRQRGITENDEASQVKEQLREEQRKSKRLETQLQRLSDRLNEKDMMKGSVGSVPHFEFSEVELGEIMAQGGFSVVHRGIWHTTNIALKKLFDPKINEELLAEFDNEVQKLEQLRHPNILMLLAVHRKPPSLSMITELVAGGSFYQLLHTPSKFNSASGPLTGISPRQTMRIMELSGTAIAFVHARGIAHRDVKTQNVLLSPTLEVKLCDFGLARMKSELMTGAMQFAGTPNYMAPEIFRNQKYTENVDVFAYGTMFWEALVVDIPFANLDPPEIRERVLAGKMLPMSGSVPSRVQQLIRNCWTIDRNARPSMAEVVVQLRVCAADVEDDGSDEDANAPQARPHRAPPGPEDSLGTLRTTHGTLGGVPGRLAATSRFQGGF